MRKLTQTLLLLLCSIISFNIYAQGESLPNTSGGLMNSNGKIYVVMAVVVVIVLGLFIYLVSIERKLKKLEKNN